MMRLGWGRKMWRRRGSGFVKSPSAEPVLIRLRRRGISALAAASSLNILCSADLYGRPFDKLRAGNSTDMLIVGDKPPRYLFRLASGAFYFAVGVCQKG